MSNSFKPELERIVPDWADKVPETVGACFTCRSGGVSSGPYGTLEGIMGLNLADHVGDASACVRMNRSILTQCLPAEPKWLKQVHGTNVVDAAQIAQGVVPEADASFTTTPGVVLVVMTADCLPLFLADRQGRGVAAIHAGWRSLAAGIIQKTAVALREAIGDAQAEFAAWLGPRIGAEDFEVGADVLDAMKANLPNAEQHFRALEGGKYLADLAGLAKDALLAANVPALNVYDCGLSTYADPKRFYSFRRDGERTGRHAALIWLDAPVGKKA